MAFSAIPAAKGQIVTAVAARAGLAGVLVQWGLPFDPPAQRERVYIADAVNVRREWVVLGRRKVDESFTVQAVCEVYQAGGEPRACEERLWAIVAEVELAVINDVTLADVLKWYAKPGVIDASVFARDDGWVAQAVVGIDCETRV